MSAGGQHGDDRLGAVHRARARRDGAGAPDHAVGHRGLEDLVDGLLHLLGFDHAEPEDEREMFGVQRDILVGFAVQEKQQRRA